MLEDIYSTALYDEKYLPTGGSAYGIPMKDTYSVPLGVSRAEPIILPICKDTLGLRSSPLKQPKIASTILCLNWLLFLWLRINAYLSFLFLCKLVLYVY